MLHSNNVKNLLSKYIEYLKENPLKHCICALDYSSLYPSLIMTYNLSPEYLILDKEFKEEIRSKGENIHNINFEYNYENYLGEKNTKYIEAWTVRHDESKEITKFGLYPTILKDLFAQRAKMKKELFIYKEKKEHIESVETDYLDNPVYKECIFKLNYCDTKQKALKVFMNTFYGELGNKNSPLFVLELAGAVTSAGQANLLLVKDYVERLGHKVYYGDSVTGDTPILIRINKKYLKLVAIEEYLKDYKYEKYNDSKEIINIDNLDIESQEIYTENGWTPIKKLIRHYTNKRLFRITTDMGSIIVTEDHSLLSENKEKISPKDCKVGTKILHWRDIDLSYEVKYKNNIRNSRLYNVNKFYSKSQIETHIKYLQLLYKNIHVKLDIINDTYILETIPKYTHLDNSIKKIEEIFNNGQYVYDLETESHHFAAGVGKMVVHNTDSLYISCPESYYLEKNKEYYTEQINKLQYNTDLVTITFKAIEDIKVKVNDYLYQNNGTKYLKMAYEEILWPCAFLSKKKYFGIPHENIPNFKPADMFIRGLEVKKRGVSEILKIICLDIMWESLDLKNTKTLRELIIQKIKEIFIKKWELKDFIQTGLWKPEKKNVTLNEFAERMKEENKTIPEPGERFNYVIIKKYPYKYDFKGRQIPLKKADKMEYLETVIDNNYEIDLKYYFDNQLSGQFARLLSYDNEFTEYSIDEDTGQFEYDDNKTLTKCKKYILQLVEMHGNNYIDRNKVFKNIYKEVSKKYKDIKYTKISIETYNKKYDILFNTLNNASDDSSNLYKLINDNIEKYVNKTYNFSILSNNIIKKYKKNDKSLIQLYNGKNTSFYKLQQNELNLRYSTKLDIFLKNIIEKKLSNIIFNIDNMNIINIIQHIRQKYNIDKICGSQEEIDTIYDIIDENELEINLLDIDLYTKIDPDLIKKIYNDYIHLIALKKLNILHTYIYNNIHIVKSSTDKDIKKPYGFKF